MNTPPSKTLRWDLSIPLITNPFMLRTVLNICLLSGLLMAALLSFIFLAAGDRGVFLPLLKMTGLVTAFIFILVLLVMVLVFGNRMPFSFHLDPHGVGVEIKSRAARRANRLAVLLGVISGKPGLAGSGLIGISQEAVFTKWGQISRIEWVDRKSIVVLKNSWRTVAILYCPEDLYPEIKTFVQDHVRVKQRINPLARLFVRTILTLLACIPLFRIDYPFDPDLFLAIFIVCFAQATIWLIPLFGYVVIAALAFRLITLLISGFRMHKSIFPSRPNYRAFDVLNGDDYFFLGILLLGVCYLVWMSLRSIRGKDQSALFSD
jgi:hypothetical protein